jgi:predicted nucleotidyltransferase
MDVAFPTPITEMDFWERASIVNERFKERVSIPGSRTPAAKMKIDNGTGTDTVSPADITREAPALYCPRTRFLAMRTAASTALDASLDLDALQAVLREHPVRLAILFGSHATEMTHATSDIDLAVEFDTHRPSDPSYNDVFLGLSADLSETLETDDVDLVDLHTVSPALAEAIFEHGVLLVGDQEHATALRRQLTATESESEQPSPRERLDAALARIDAHLDSDDAEVSLTGTVDDDR